MASRGHPSLGACACRARRPCSRWRCSPLCQCSGRRSRRALRLPQVVAQAPPRAPREGAPLGRVSGQVPTPALGRSRGASVDPGAVGHAQRPGASVTASASGLRAYHQHACGASGPRRVAARPLPSRPTLPRGLLPALSCGAQTHGAPGNPAHVRKQGPMVGTPGLQRTRHASRELRRAGDTRVLLQKRSLFLTWAGPVGRGRPSFTDLFHSLAQKPPDFRHICREWPQGPTRVCSLGGSKRSLAPVTHTVLRHAQGVPLSQVVSRRGRAHTGLPATSPPEAILPKATWVCRDWPEKTV